MNLKLIKDIGYYSTLKNAYKSFKSFIEKYMGEPLLKEKEKPKRKQKKTTTQLKKKLDELFSKYIRIKYSNSDGMSSCYTCGSVKHYKQLQAGHFISRKELAVRFDEKNVRPQCFGCNAKHLGNGMVVKFGQKLEMEYGKGIIQKLHIKAREITKYFPYELKIAEYEKKLKSLS